MEEFDAIVVGGGHQGLVAATRLADADLSTVVVEASSEVGGAVRSAEVTEPGFIHDLFATNMNLFLGSPYFARYGAALAAEGLRFARADRPYASVFPGGRSLRISSDEAETLAMWREHSEGDLAGWMRLREVFDAVAASYLPLYTSPQPSRSIFTALRAVRRSRQRVSADRLVSTLLGSTRTLGERYFATPEARSLVAAWGMHLDYAPDIAGGAVFPLLELYLDMMNGMSLVEGGASRLPEAMAALVRHRGGTVLTGAPVTRIDTDSTGAIGVTLADGRRLRARRGIISTAGLPHLVNDLLAGSTVPSRMRQAADDYRYGPGTFMLHLALDGPVPWADQRLAGYGYVHAGGDVDQMARTYQQALAHQLPDEPLLVVGQTSVVDPTRVPEPGRHVVWIQVRAVPGNHIAGDATGQIVGCDWSRVGEAFADRVVELLERYAPGVSELVRARAAFTPNDLERINRNLVGGDGVGGSHHLDQFMLLRPSLSLSRYRTAVPRLFLAGAGTWPGGGVNAVSGGLAAEALLAGRGWRPPLPIRGRR
jgi:phytoene dehydrogenase-like protein